VLLAGLTAAWLLLACAPALAHANLVEASPPRGNEVSKPPERVELRFSEPVDAEFDPVVVRAAGGARVDAHDARVDPEDARVVLADLKSVPTGSYTVKWRVTSIDGHVVEGRYDFAVVAAGENRPPSEDARDRDTSAEAAGAQSEHHAAHHGGGAGRVASTDRRDPVPEPAAGRAASRAANTNTGSRSLLLRFSPAWRRSRPSCGFRPAGSRASGAMQSAHSGCWQGACS
jgi:copper resistance protein C